MQELTTWSATRLAQAIRQQEVSSEEVVRAHLARIEEINPRINAVTVLNHEALAQARAADQALAQGEEVGPLHGVPFTVKDTLATPGLVSPLEAKIRSRPVRQDATGVARMKEAGAILLAKSNCPPRGSGSDTENAIVGQTVNPHDPRRSAGGSSGGEAALIASGCSPLGLGSDTGGGVRVPAHYCGISAIKPTLGRIPNTGAYGQPGGFTDQRTQIGPMARSVADLFLALRVLVGPDYVDAGAVPMPLYDPAQLPLKDLTVGWFAYDPDSLVNATIADAVGSSAQALARAGAQMVENRPLDMVGGGRDLDHGWRNRAATRGQDLVELYHVWDQYRTNMLQHLRHYDAILCPADHHTAPLVGERDSQRFDYTVPFSLTGYPAVVVPVAKGPEGLPVGVQIASHPWREDIALALAAALTLEKSDPLG
jgi:amidase